MSQETIRLYHSTDKQSWERAKQMDMLLGYEQTNPPSNHSGCSNLTTDRKSSVDFIRCYRGEGQWTNREGPPELFLLTFVIPKELVKSVGKTHIFGCDEFATTLTIDADEVPEVYLEHLHAGMR